MAMESFATPYPVIFNDGGRDHDKGQVGVHSVLTFKRFQILLSQKVGLPATQLSAVFVCRRTGNDTVRQQKLPINENTNFNIILNQHNPMWEKDCFFLVSVKRSKKERKGTRRRNLDVENGDDDCSVSPRSGASLKDERPKLVELAETREVQDPDHQQAASVGSPVLSPMHPDGKSDNEKGLLQRQKSKVDISAQPRAQAERLHGPASVEMKPLPGFPCVDMKCGEKDRADEEQLALWPMCDSKLVPAPPLTHESEELQNKNLAMAAGRTVFLHRGGILQLPVPVTIPSSSPHILPVRYCPSANSALSRVPNGTSLTLQQAQAQYLNLQLQCPDRMQLNLETVSKIRGVVRDHAGNHKTSGGCPHCSTFRARKINPTPFHLCVHDKVTTGFRGPSPAGPIERAAKRLEASVA